MSSNLKTLKVAQISILSALMVVFTYLSNYIQIGEISINLALIVIVVAAIKVGKKEAFLIGLINGLVILLMPSTSLFYAMSVPGTIIVCLLKSGLAGLISGYLYELLKNKLNHKLVVLICAGVVPIINTLVFIIGSLIFFNGAFGTLINLFLSFNFVIEEMVTIVLSLMMNYFLK